MKLEIELERKNSSGGARENRRAPAVHHRRRSDRSGRGGNCARRVFDFDRWRIVRSARGTGRTAALRVTVADREWRADDSRPARVAPQSKRRRRSGRAAAGACANAGKDRARAGASRRRGGSGAGPAGGGSDENAERNSLAEIRNRGALVGDRRSDGKCGRSARDHRLKQRLACYRRSDAAKPRPNLQLDCRLTSRREVCRRIR